jgi:hypothetical protein
VDRHARIHAEFALYIVRLASQIGELLGSYLDYRAKSVGKLAALVKS